METRFDTSQINLRELSDDIRKTVIRKLSQVAYDESRKGGEIHVKTGKLQRALYNRQRGEGRAVGIDPVRAFYGIFVLLGTRPHKIFPKDKKVLRWPKDGKFIFAKSVNHSGYRGDNYLFRGGDEAIKQFRSIVEEATKEVDNANT